MKFNLALFFVGMAIMVTIHQWYICGKVFELGDIHHEMFIVTFAFTAVIVFLLQRKHIAHEV